ncbi:rho GTPase-activating protein 11A-like isoform X2 [Saccostrea cucullata]|uniref:rho GTPase-activating protein 11A-like isoform X2 n=1 Tax=Saccostrea cuccullata TaxID=36930 RepID=UPI002ED61004
MEDNGHGDIFGNFLSLVPCVYIADCGYVPKLLVDAASLIHENIEQEGLFRKSGAVSRQKQLKQQIENGKGVHGANVYDVTGLIKQFFRKLPDPLLTSVYHDSFIKCYHIDPSDVSTQAVLSLCLLLPGEHLSTLRYFMLLLSDVANCAEQNKMDATNLAVVLAPNIMHLNNKTEKMNSSEEKLLQVQTAIVEVLIRSASMIGMVSPEVYEKASLITEIFGTDDELDASCDTLEESRDLKKKEKRRKRSGSFQGVISTIAKSVTKWRRSTDGKSNTSQSSNMSTMSQYSNKSHISNKANSSNLQTIHTDIATATPVVIRKRKASGEMPFSASKKKAILKNLPNQATLANTPYTPASTVKKLDINEMKRAGTLNTPSIAFSNKNKLAFSATPCQSNNKTARKKLGLFSPASARKGRKLSSSSISIPNASKKNKSKGIFRRFSGGKGDNQPMAISSDSQMSDSIGQRLAGQDDDDSNSPGPDNVNTSSTALDVSNGSLNVDQSNFTFGPDQSIISVCDDRNSLNEGFICSEDVDMSQADTTTLSSVCSDGAINRNRSSTCGEPVRTCLSDSSVNCSRLGSDSSVDRSDVFDKSLNVSKRTKILRRGRPNSLKAGLLSGEPRKVQNLRRSFGLDKSEISDPIPLYVPDVADMESTSLNKSNEHERQHEVSSVKETLKDIQALESNLNSQSFRKSLSINDLSLKTENDTQSLLVGKTQDGEKVTENPKFQTCDSTDSLLSGQQSVSASPETKKKAMQRSISTDSGKGSMFDESGVMDASSSQDADQFLDGNLGMDVIENILSAGAPSSVTENKDEKEIRKSLSSTNLVKGDKPRLSISRSQSVYNAASKRQPNITPNLQISTETHNLLSRAGYISKKGMKKTSDDDFQVMGPPPPRIKQAEFHKPKRESILELKVKHAGRVAASIKQFETGDITPAIANKAVENIASADLVERHNSPLRFPNCVSRKAGASPLKLPSMLTRKESLANKKSDCHPNKLLSKGQARLPISTQLLKPTEQATVTNVDTPNTGSNFRKPVRRPSIYYAKDGDTPKVDKFKDTRIDDSVFEAAVATPLPEEPMETSEDSIKENPQNKENVSTIESIKEEESEDSISDTLTGTPLKSETIDNVKTAKLPKILQPLGDSVILRSPAGLTPKQMLQRSQTTCSPRSPIKAVKRLGSSPGSPALSRRHSMSPRRTQHKISLPASVPEYLHDEMNGM